MRLLFLFRGLAAGWIIPVLLLAGCKQQHQSEQLFTTMDETGIRFTNTIHNSPGFNIFSYRNFYNGGGVAAADFKYLPRARAGLV